MAEGSFFIADGIAVLAATNTLAESGDLAIENIVLTGTAAGTFVFVIGGATLTVSTGAADLTIVIPINRTVKSISLTSGPTGAAMIAFMKQKVG